MKKLSIVWYILGAVVLIGLGFVAGYALNGGLLARTAVTAGGVTPYYGMMPHMRVFGGPLAGRGLPLLGFGLGWLMMLVLWVGAAAGIVSLIILLTTRRSAPAAPAQSTSAPAAAAPTLPSTPTETPKK